MRFLTPLLIALSAGCAFDEHLPQVDIHGTVVVPREAATRTVYNIQTGQDEEIVDPRSIGAVFLGAFASIDEAGLNYDFPHPELGPIFKEDEPGNAYPYGGGTVGRFEFACYQALVCKVVTGRFTSYDDLLDYFTNVVQEPVVDDLGSVVDSAAAFQAYCFELFNYTDDDELRFFSDDLDFVENSDGDFEADYDMWQVTYYQNMQLWGWVDSPDENYRFSTCDSGRGGQNQEYNNNYYYGANVIDVLNFPGENISAGDFVVGDPATITAEDADAFRDSQEEPRLVIDFPVE